MVFSEFKGIKISALGFGAMRLPVFDGDDSRPNEAVVQKMVDAAMTGGINYYDSAWGYHGGHSEEVMGRCLSGYPTWDFCPSHGRDLCRSAALLPLCHPRSRTPGAYPLPVRIQTAAETL